VIRPTPIEPWEAGLAVRREWPDQTHEFVRFSLSPSDVERSIRSDRNYWRRSHLRPTHAVVAISRREFDLHRTRPDCRAPDCPAPSRDAKAITEGIRR